MSIEDIETLKLNLETKRLELDAEIRRAEMAEKRQQRELEEKKADLDHQMKAKELDLSVGRGLRFTSAQATVAAAVLALVSGGIGGVVQAWSTRDIEAGKSNALIALESIKVKGGLAQDKQKLDASDRLEREKFETTLILKAIDTPSRDSQIKNLQFFLAAGFITDPFGKIKNIKLDDYPTATLQRSVVSAGMDLSDFDQKLITLLSVFGETPDSSALRQTQAALAPLVTVRLNANQQSALTALAYNVGVANVAQSQLLTKLNQGDPDGAAAEFMRWTKAAGRELPGLVRRRQAEMELFKAPVETPTPKPDK